MTEKLDKHVLGNGMVILGESMEAVQSVAFGFMLPSGAARLPDGCGGAGNIIRDWIFRGAGKRDNRELVEALDGLGLHRSSGVGSSHIMIGAVLEADNLGPALELYADIILRPRLEKEQFELSRQLATQALLGLDDDPRGKVGLKLREQFYPQPLGRSPFGSEDELKNLTAEKAGQIIKHSFKPSQIIFSVAGKYDFDRVCKQLENLFEDNTQNGLQEVTTGHKGEQYVHEQHDGAQVHIGVMTATVPVSNKDYYDARMAVSVLSGGMSARLFTEVREKRGLCYAIGAHYHSLKDMAGIGCYAGTTPEKAQETLDVVLREFNRLTEGISDEEIETAKVKLKSTLIMESESSSSRAGGIASDYYLLGRVRLLSEIKEKIEERTVESVLNFLRNNSFRDFTIVTVGPRDIKVRDKI